jgi:hypothetical protein
MYDSAFCIAAATGLAAAVESVFASLRDDRSRVDGLRPPRGRGMTARAADAPALPRMVRARTPA